MKKLFFYVFSAILMIAAGCSMTQEYAFNKDWSGSSKFELDMTQFKTFMKGMDSTGNNNSLDTIDRSLKETADLLKEAGATNIEYGWNDDKTILHLTYDFKDIETLNKAIQTGGATNLFSSEKSDDKVKAKFTASGKNFSYDAPEMSQDSTINKEQMESMKDYFKYSLIFSFGRRVKKFDNKNAVLSSDMKKLTFSGSFSDAMKEGYTTDLNVKLKRK